MCSPPQLVLSAANLLSCRVGVPLFQRNRLDFMPLTLVTRLHGQIASPEVTPSRKCAVWLWQDRSKWTCWARCSWTDLSAMGWVCGFLPAGQRSFGCLRCPCFCSACPEPCRRHWKLQVGSDACVLWAVGESWIWSSSRVIRINGSSECSCYSRGSESDTSGLLRTRHFVTGCVI